MSSYPVLEAHNHIGSYVRFEFFSGWTDTETLEGWLHGTSQTEPHEQDQMVWMHIDDDQKLEPDTEAWHLGGYGLGFHRTFEVVHS